MLHVPARETTVPEPQFDTEPPARAPWQTRLLILAGLLAGAFGFYALLQGAPPASKAAPATPHQAVTDHVPFFIPQPGSSDGLMLVMAVVLVLIVLGMGVLFFWLHSLPERMVHNSTKFHFDVVAVLGLLSLFTHIHAFWVAALLIAFIPMPDLSSSYFGRLTRAMERIADGNSNRDLPNPPADGPKG
jgi:hypothetical protein